MVEVQVDAYVRNTDHLIRLSRISGKAWSLTNLNNRDVKPLLTTPNRAY